MKLAKGEPKPVVKLVKVDWEVEKHVAEQIQAMEDHTKIPKSELVTTALKRFISAHKDYLPERNGD